jgi:hypothetical protein
MSELEAYYAEHRAHVMARFANMRPVEGTRRRHVSPSGRFELLVDTYDEDGRSWDYSRGIVKHVGSEAVIADVHRNLGHFMFAWIEHPTGEYVVCGEDYQGYNVIDLERGQQVFSLPEEYLEGMGFCWAQVFPSPDGLVLAVNGCIWAAPTEVVFYDFRDPLAIPLPELGRLGWEVNMKGWTSNWTFELRVEDPDSEEESNVVWRRPDAPEVES